MNELQAFVKPYPQVALDGELGLTSEDVSRAIGVRHSDLLKDLRKRHYVGFLESAGFQLKEFSPNRKGPGRKGKAFAFDTDAAKALVATSRTELGAGYLRYLLACERAVEQGVPALKAELAEVQAKLAVLMAKPRRVRGPERKHCVVAGFQTVTDLWGNTAKVPVYRHLTRSEMTDEERRAFDAQHLARVSAGAAAQAAKLLSHQADPSPPRAIPISEKVRQSRLAE